METGATDQAPLRLTPPRGSCEEANPERQPKRRQRMLMHSFPDRFGQRIAGIPDRLAAAVAESAKHIAELRLTRKTCPRTFSSVSSVSESVTLLSCCASLATSSFSLPSSRAVAR